MKFVILAALVVNVVALSGCGGGGGSSQPPVQADVDSQGNCSPNLMADVSRLGAVQMQTQAGGQAMQGYQAPGTYGLTQNNVAPNSQLTMNQQQVAACDAFFARHAATVSCKVPATAQNPQTAQMVMPPGSTLTTSTLKQQCDLQRSAYAQQLNGQNAGQQWSQTPGQVNSQAGTLSQNNGVPAQNQITSANAPAANAQNNQVEATPRKKKKKVSHKVIAETVDAQNSAPAPSCTAPVRPGYSPLLSTLKPCEVVLEVGDTNLIFAAYTQNSLIANGVMKRQCDVGAQEDTCTLISTDGNGSTVVQGETLVVSSKNEIGLAHGRTQLTLTFTGKSLGVQCVKHGAGFSKQDLERILGEQFFSVKIIRIR